jgi:hypothetical protein
MKATKPARYVVLSAEEATAVETDSLDRAQEYASNWARVTGGTYRVLDRGEDSMSTYLPVVFTAKAPGKEGTPLPRPQNPPPAYPDVFFGG